MSKDQKVVLILHKGDTQEQSRLDSTHEPHMRIIALVELLARHAAEQDFRAELSDASGEREDGREK